MLPSYNEVLQSQRRRRSRAFRPRSAPVRLAATVAALALVVAGCGGDSGSGATTSATADTSAGSESGGGEPYVIGVSNDLSGPFSVNGVPATAGINAAVQVANDNGGINGHPIELIVRDDASDVNRGSANLREFASQDASAVVGTVSSAVIAAQAPLLEESKLPLVGIGVPSNLLDPVQPYIFMADASYEQQASAQVQLVKQLSDDGSLSGPPVVSAIHLGTPAGEAWLSAVQAAATEQGITIAEAQSVQPTAASYNAQVARVKDAGSNVVLTFVSTPGITAAVNAMHELNVDQSTYLVNFDITTNAEFLRQLNWPHFVTLSTFDLIALASDPKFQSLRDAFGAQGGDYGILASVVGYVSAQLVIEALAGCGYPCPGESLQPKLQELQTDLNGVAFGEVGFSSQSHAAVSQAQFYSWDTASNAFSTVGPVLQLDRG